MPNGKLISAPGSLIVGLIAGAAAALLLAGARGPSTLSILLVASSCLPVLIAGMGWSNLAAIVAVGTAAALIAVLSEPLVALSATLTSLGPAAWIAHLNNLARPAEEIGGPPGRMAWYPLSDILFQISALVTMALLVMGWVIGYGPAMADELVDALVTLFGEANSEMPLTVDMISEMKGLMLRLLPVFQGLTWVGFLFSMYYLARLVVRISGRSQRPRDDFAAQLRMPRTGLWVFLAGLALTFLPGMLELVGWTIVGTFGAGFALTGFALMHDATRGKPWRLAAIWLAYLSVIIFTVPLLVFLAFGLSSTGRMATMTPRDPKP
ncbi:DUF2232 domain-containing protein [Pseudohoeflea coraliihabitans]|uniref:YybS family protein n=1 Tax=Pseudohoeflea coraliihabitans TaxID=2860393 RepID=A0ABS6WRU7_9HYPH|nr:DUF2232 domain-containing protein [Pseudohoeflea sp. DP4N28-3]MBW3098693.1 YybS family protein [Pseudohoeflea sp. DP4N28-3]